MCKKRNLIFTCIIIVFVGYAFQISLQSLMRPYAINGFYFQQWSSEKMMGAVSIEDLRDAPLESLYNLHVQPPGFDIIRTILVHIWPSPDSITAVKHVDSLLYLLLALLYGLMGLLIFLWTSKLTNERTAIFAVVVFLLHPACISYATFLNYTFPLSLLILWAYYLLWKIKSNYDVSIILFSIVILALFFTRASFQLPVIFVFAASLLLIRVPMRKVLLFLLITGGVMGLYMGKQYYKFGTFSTSSFTGLYLCRSVGTSMNIREYGRYLDNINNNSNPESQKSEKLANVLTRKRKIGGARNFNNIGYLNLNQQLIEDYKKYIHATPKKALIKSYLTNLSIYFRPSSRCYRDHTNIIVDRLPWRSVYDRIFSFPILIGLIIVAGIIWIIKVFKYKNYAVSIALLLPGIYIFLLSVLFEKGENMRFKFFLEPVLFVFLVSQFYAAGVKYVKPASSLNKKIFRWRYVLVVIFGVLVVLWFARDKLEGVTAGLKSVKNTTISLPWVIGCDRWIVSNPAGVKYGTLDNPRLVLTPETKDQPVLSEKKFTSPLTISANLTLASGTRQHIVIRWLDGDLVRVWGHKDKIIMQKRDSLKWSEHIVIGKYPVNDGKPHKWVVRDDGDKITIYIDDKQIGVHQENFLSDVPHNIGIDTHSSIVVCEKLSIIADSENQLQ